MTALQASSKSAVTVSEMAEMCLLSRSRFYSLLEAGVFPRPVLHPSSKRPMYDLDLQRKCLEIRETGIGMNGVPVLFNRKPNRIAQRKSQRKVAQDKTPDHPELMDALKGLGLERHRPGRGRGGHRLVPLGVRRPGPRRRGSQAVPAPSGPEEVARGQFRRRLGPRIIPGRFTPEECRT